MAGGHGAVANICAFRLVPLSRAPWLGVLCACAAARCTHFPSRSWIRLRFHSGKCSNLSRCTQSQCLFLSLGTDLERRGIAHNVQPNTAVGRRHFINAQWPGGGGPWSELLRLFRLTYNRYFKRPERRCWACYAFVPHAVMIAPRDGRAVLLSQTTNSFRSHQQIILFFSQRTRAPCGMTHNVSPHHAVVFGAKNNTHSSK